LRFGVGKRGARDVLAFLMGKENLIKKIIGAEVVGWDIL